MLPVVNTGIALAIVFDMVILPTSIWLALGAIAFEDLCECRPRTTRPSDTSTHSASVSAPSA